MAKNVILPTVETYEGDVIGASRAHTSAWRNYFKSLKVGNKFTIDASKRGFIQQQFKKHTEGDGVKLVTRVNPDDTTKVVCYVTASDAE